MIGIVGGQRSKLLVVLACQGSELAAGALAIFAHCLQYFWSGRVKVFFIKQELPGQIAVFMVVFPVDDVGVVVELEGCAVKMDKCAKAQIDKFFCRASNCVIG